MDNVPGTDTRTTQALIGIMPSLSQQLLLLTQYLLQIEADLPGSLLAMAHLEIAQEHAGQALAALRPAPSGNGKGSP